MRRGPEASRLGRLRTAGLGVAVATTAAAVLLTAAPAHAHTDLEATNPRANAQLSSAPRVVSARFAEPVTGGSTAVAVIDSAGHRRSGAAKIAGATVTAPVGSLPKGRYALTYAIRSGDGHAVGGASAFSVGVGTPAASAVTVTVTKTKARLSGARVGVRTFTLPFDTKGGEVWFKHPSLAQPFVWPLHGRTATGMLPFPGTYAITVFARVSTFEAKILDGRVAIAG